MTPILDAVKKHFAKIGYQHGWGELQNAVRSVYEVLEYCDGDIEVALNELYPEGEISNGKKS